MKKLERSLDILLLLLALVFGSAVPAAKTLDHSLTAHMILMDEYGEPLSHYSLETFRIEDSTLIYNDPPLVLGYHFVTVNILELVTEEGSSYRVTYYYSSEEGEDEPIPKPLPLAELPKKSAPREERRVWLSWTDASLRELRDSASATFTYSWDAFEIPPAEKIPGYSYQSLATGYRTLDGKAVPHFVYIYGKGGEDQVTPSLLFGHLIEERPIRTIKAESLSPKESVPAGSKPGSGADSRAQSLPQHRSPGAHSDTAPTGEAKTIPGAITTAGIPDQGSSMAPGSAPKDSVKSPWLSPLLFLSALGLVGGIVVFRGMRKK